MSNISSSNICENFMNCYFMISGAKGQKVVRACTIRLLIWTSFYKKYYLCQKFRDLSKEAIKKETARLYLWTVSLS